MAWSKGSRPISVVKVFQAFQCVLEVVVLPEDTPACTSFCARRTSLKKWLLWQVDMLKGCVLWKGGIKVRKKLRIKR